MNTDKLMELERKWRAEADAMADSGRPSLGWRTCADELAAALRAEQAVGDEQIARELAEIAAWHRRMNLELSGKGSEWAAKEMYACRHGKFAETLERALGTARQSEGMVPVPREPTEAMLRAAQKAQMDHSSFDDWIEFDGGNVKREYAAMLAAAPGGEGEG